MVTGAAAGLGQAIAKHLGLHGGRVIVTDINEPGAQNTAAEIVSAGGNALALQHDVLDESAWDQVFAALLESYGGIDVLVNNAGGGTFSDLETMTLSDWKQVISLNLDSTFMGTQRAIKAMKNSGGGSIINISSVAGLVGSPTVVPYSAAKGGIRLFSKSAAVYCAQQNYNIRINSVHPGLIRTESGMEMAAKAFGMPETEAEQVMASLHPIGRIGEPHEVAATVLFLASDESSFVTGAEYAVDGGYTAQ